MKQLGDSAKRSRYARELHRFLRRATACAEDKTTDWPRFCAVVAEALKKLELTEAVALYSPYYTEMIRLAEAVRLRACEEAGDRADLERWLSREMNQLEKMRRVGGYKRSGNKRYEDEEWE